MRRIRWLAIVWAVLCLMSCATHVHHPHRVPVTDAAYIEKIPTTGTHKVLSNETLYSIAWRYGLDYRYVAKLNQIKPPYHIESGEIIYLRPKSQIVNNRVVNMPPATVKPIASREQVKTKKVMVKQFKHDREPTGPVTRWYRPAKGAISSNFSSRNKGLNIYGQNGDPVYAAATGKVVYAGNGLRDYGNLIIIKHNSAFLTAYAHNSKILVTEGDWVQGGQQIAEMGSLGSRRVLLHFEIRRNGKPVNPLLYLR